MLTSSSANLGVGSRSSVRRNDDGGRFRADEKAVSPLTSRSVTIYDGIDIVTPLRTAKFANTGHGNHRSIRDRDATMLHGQDARISKVRIGIAFLGK
jgi:hypothetical protein